MEPGDVGLRLFMRTFLDDRGAISQGIPEEHLEAFFETVLATYPGRVLDALPRETLTSLPQTLQARIRTALQ
jgi:hypothetical protein